MAPQSRQGRGVEPAPLALAQHRTVPIEAKPGQIGQDRSLSTGPIAGRVEVVEAQQPSATPQPGVQPTQQGRAQVAAVQSAGGGWGETAAIPPLALGQAGLNQGLQGGWQRRSSQQGEIIT